MLDNPIKAKTKNNSRIKYEVSKPHFLIPCKIDKLIQKNSKKLKYNYDKENKKKIEKIKEKINLLQEMLKNKSSINSKKNKNSLSKEKMKKGDEKINLYIDKDNITKKYKKTHYEKNIKSPFQTGSNIYNKHLLNDSNHSRFNSELEYLLNDSHHLGNKNKKEHLNKKQKENNITTKIKIGDFYIQELTYREKNNKMRNIGNYSIDKENTSIDKSVNFNQLKNNIKEFKENNNNVEDKNNKKNLLQPYNKSADIKLSTLNIDYKSNIAPKLKQDKILPFSTNYLEEEMKEMNIIPISNNSNFSSRKNLTHNNHSIAEQIETKPIDNFCKDTPSTKNTLKTEARIDNILQYKNNKLATAETSIKNSGRKKKLLNKSMNKIYITKKQKALNNSSKKFLLDKLDRVKNSNSHENRNKNNVSITKSKILYKNNKILNNKISKKFSINRNILDVTTSPLIKTQYNITRVPSKKNISKNIISLKKAPINYKLNFNSPMGYYSIKKDYDSILDINKKTKKNNKKKKPKHSSFNISQSILKRIQDNYRNNNNTTTINIMNKSKLNKTEKNSKKNTYKNNNKLNDISDRKKIITNRKNEKENEIEEEKEEKECIPQVFSVSLRQSDFKKKEYPNMAKRLSSSQPDISLKNNDFYLRQTDLIYKETKIVKSIESLCKKGFSGPGIKKTNQDNFFIFNNFNNNQNYIYMGVCDGHGIFGQDISSYLVNNLPQNLNKDIINQNIKNLSTEKISSLAKILESTFIQTNINLNTDERIDSTYSGSTCVTLLFTPTRIICINVGDSRCIMGKFNNNKWFSKNLTRDHKPSEPDEMERIISSGGKVEAYRDNLGNFVGPERVWKKEGDAPGLAMSRSFGDEVAHTIGVIVNPEINEYQLLNEDKFIVLASDGIWEFISSEEVVNIVKDYYLDNDIEGALTCLYKEASKRWIMEEEVIDDITIILVFLN